MGWDLLVTAVVSLAAARIVFLPGAPRGHGHSFQPTSGQK